ncbi:MAG: heavy metal-binding domain-containing protein [Oscillospiraceae bacterium]|nr:heavy metal-binding domain-containing protein [Oscillospiraceae bacterium]
MIFVTTEGINGKELEVLGMARGSSVQCRHIGKDIGASFKTLVGGEMVAYKEMMDDARDIATSRMLEEAANMGADAVVAVRFTTSAITQGAAEVLAYGTAVRFK